jgi:hypothetical protein
MLCQLFDYFGFVNQGQREDRGGVGLRHLVFQFLSQIEQAIYLILHLHLIFFVEPLSFGFYLSNIGEFSRVN